MFHCKVRQTGEQVWLLNHCDTVIHINNIDIECKENVDTAITGSNIQPLMNSVGNQGSNQ